MDGEYADPSMKLVVFDVHEADKEHLLDLAETAKTLIAGTCPVKNTGDSIPAPTAAGACYTLTFPNANPSTTDFHATVTTTGVANVAFFAAYAPTEFERDTHYLMDDGMTAAEMASATAGNTVASGWPVEPGAQTDAGEYNCRFSPSIHLVYLPIYPLAYLPTYLPTHLQAPQGRRPGQDMRASVPRHPVAPRLLPARHPHALRGGALPRVGEPVPRVLHRAQVRPVPHKLPGGRLLGHHCRRARVRGAQRDVHAGRHVLPL